MRSLVLVSSLLLVACTMAPEAGTQLDSRPGATAASRPSRPVSRPVSRPISRPASRPPNIVLLWIDDLGYKDVGFLGGKVPTPNIDRLARGGMVFTNAYANAPNCAPSRACLMTGLYGPRHGVYTVGRSDRGRPRDRKLVPTPNKRVLAARFVTMAEMLRDAGYRTAQVGKWHLGRDPRTQGFDVNVRGNQRGATRSHFNEDGSYLTDTLTDAALKFIRGDGEREGKGGRERAGEGADQEESQDKPFFLCLSHFAVHTPIHSKPEMTRRFGGRYQGMIASVDESVGRVLRALEKQGVADDTVVVFFSDNGGHGPVTSMKPLRGSKGMLYEGGIRVPLAVRWPGQIKPGSRCDVPVIGSDLFPTFGGMARAKVPENDGVDLGPLLTGKIKRLDRAALHWHFPAYLQKNRGMQQPFRTTPAAAIRSGNFKLIEFFEDGRLELYDLSKDIGEQNNLAKTMPEKTKELHAAMRAWRKRVRAPVPTEKNPRYRSRRQR